MPGKSKFLFLLLLPLLWLAGCDQEPEVPDEFTDDEQAEAPAL